jgi:pimeloyl-ACP methyl ester carboxylesterase
VSSQPRTTPTPPTSNVPVRSGLARVGDYVARDGTTRDVELAYDVFGTTGRPLVLVMGIGAQRIFWDEAMCELFVHAGFHVVRFDHRDIGESTHLDAVVPPPLRAIARSLMKLPVTAPYSLSDMANDVEGLMDAVGIEHAHVVGVSLGGMIAQHFALEHANRASSVTTIMTTPGGRRFLPQPHAFKALFAGRPKTREEAGHHVAKLFAAIGSTAWPQATDRLRALGELAYERGMNPRGFLRHFAAVGKSGDRRSLLPGVTVPTLVIHGSRDPMFPLHAGRTLANLVPNATWLPITGMGHDLPEALWPTLVSAIARHAERADARASARV